MNLTIKSKIMLLFPIFIYGLAQTPDLMHYHFDKASTRLVELSGRLDEISGLAVAPDGRLFAHNDEKGKIFQLDFINGEIIKEFDLGKKRVEEDFEDIAIVGRDFYMVTSKGDIYKFNEGGNNDEVEYEVYETKLKSKYDVEGLCYDPETNALLLACKEFAGKGFDESRAVYSFSLNNMKIESEPRFLIQLEKLKHKKDIEKFKPSAIKRHPAAGSFFIVGGKSLAVIELSKDGKVISTLKLNPEIHKQPEGIEFLPDLTMVVCDEKAGGEKAKLTFYEYVNEK